MEGFSYPSRPFLFIHVSTKVGDFIITLIIFYISKKKASWLMQLKHLETSTFKTYLGLVQIAKNMALMAAKKHRKKRG
jgi:hypothetical protein